MRIASRKSLPLYDIEKDSFYFEISDGRVIKIR